MQGKHYHFLNACKEHTVTYRKQSEHRNYYAGSACLLL